MEGAAAGGAGERGRPEPLPHVLPPQLGTHRHASQLPAIAYFTVEGIVATFVCIGLCNRGELPVSDVS